MKYPIYSLFIFIALLSAPLFAEPPTYSIKKTSYPPKIDGVLFDSCWKDAECIDSFSLNYPNKPSNIKTKAWLTFDDEYLYIAVEAFDSALDKLKADIKDFDRKKNL